MSRDIYPSYSFGASEHLTSTKLNNLLLAMEHVRRSVGPFSISFLVATGAGFQASGTGGYIQLDDDPYVLGFGKSGDEVNANFYISYYDGGNVTTGYARWATVRFQESVIETATGYRVKLIDGAFNTSPYGQSTLVEGTVDSSNVVISGANINFFRCFVAATGA